MCEAVYVQKPASHELKALMSNTQDAVALICV